MSKKSSPVPGTEDLIAYLNANGGKVGKKEIARAFRLHGDERIKLKKKLKELKESGKIAFADKKPVAADGLPERCACEITGTDSDGELIARPLKWEGPAPAPQILITDNGRLPSGSSTAKSCAAFPTPRTGSSLCLKKPARKADA